MTATSREIWSKQDLMEVARRQKPLFWIVLMNFLVAGVCLGPILAVASRSIEDRLMAQATRSPATASPPPAQPSAAPAAGAQPDGTGPSTNQATVEADTPPAAPRPSRPGPWGRAYRHLARFGAAVAGSVAAGLSFVAWGLVIPASIILSSLVTIYCNRRLATAVRATAAWHYINPLIMITAAVLVMYDYSRIAVAFAALEPWAFIVVSMLSLLSLGALFPVVRLDVAATSLLDRHGIAFGALGAKMDGAEPQDLRRFRCPKCEIDLLPEQEFWDGPNAKCIRCGTVAQRLPASSPAAADTAPAAAR